MLTRADLTGAKLGPLEVGAGRVVRADLTRACLKRADLSGADLTRARLIEAETDGAKFERANLTHAEMDQGVMAA